jgi:hypothetical protein
MQYHTNGGLGMNTHDPWAANLARTVIERQERQAREHKALLDEHEMMREQGPRLWETLKNELQIRIDEFNTAYGRETPLKYEIKSEDTVEVQLLSSVGGVTFHFIPNALQITQVNTSADFSIAFVEGQIVWFSDGLGAKSSEQLAKYILADVASYI